MRWYDIQIESSKKVRFTAAPYYPFGVTDPNALNIEFDILAAPFASPQNTSSFVRIWGVSLETIGQASDFNGAAIKIYGGMRAGFPLANPSQSGLLVQGKVWQAFGNWVGTDQSLDLIIVASGDADPDQQLNISWEWQKGQPMSQAISSTLKKAAPSVTQDIQISPSLVLQETETGAYQSLSSFANHVLTTSKAIIGGTYPGVQIVQLGNTFSVYDGTVTQPAKQIEFNDLIGQPTWIEPQSIQFNCVLRADLKMGQKILMPKTAQQTQTAESLPRYRDKSAFQGEFIITAMRHVGNFRQPDGNAWITVINAASLTPATVGA